MPLDLFQGLVRGASRKVMTGKRGNKNFYKGRGVKPTGFHTKKGHYVIVPKKVPEFVVPDLTDFELKPYVSYQSPKVVCQPLTENTLMEQITQNLQTIRFKETP
ncbi:39S ribosomal protein L41, mitochondrial-like [Xenia sp. Carnegie-2017]|uniref:39S ribosomal protein L41, mitochondrial-like n=1 Tax=Xenia sp. Carnegie-2017 TaxID=2897299 RepID=UPI001F046C78|nr:39S ribosomal protein L41, mitochondrial-like [Xenia sp. Carnegie-2017]